MKITGLGDITPDYPIGALEEYYTITGEDILFDNALVDTISKRKVFVYVGLKYGSPKKVKELSDIDRIKSSEFINVVTGCLDVFTKEFKIEEVEGQEDSNTEKK